MNIAYSCNDYYIPQTGISMISLFENNRQVDDICIYFVSKNASQSNISILKQIAEKYGRIFTVVNFDDIAYDLHLSATGRHIETIYTKVFFSRIDGLEKIIYLDSDTIIAGSLKELWNDDYEGYYMGVVETNPTKYYKELGLPQGAPFFNDGMAIVNVEYCRRNNLIEKVLDVVNEFDGNPPTLSEGALNKVCYGKVKFISLRYNLMAGLLFMAKSDADYLCKTLHYDKEDVVDSCNNPVVIHYLSAFYNRPWFKKCNHPYKDEYYKYKLLSPWKNEPLKEGDLPRRVKLIAHIYKILGVRLTECLRRLLDK